MDWHAWLSATRLDPELVYEYALVFARNELEADDVAFLDHELLHSMGVSVAKHRLEILKLAWRERRRASTSKPPAPRLLDGVARYVRALVRREEGATTALVLVPCHQQQPDESNSKPRGKALRRAKSEPKGSTPRHGVGGRAAAAVHAVNRDVDSGGREREEMVRYILEGYRRYSCPNQLARRTLEEIKITTKSLETELAVVAGNRHRPPGNSSAGHPPTRGQKDPIA